MQIAGSLLRNSSKAEPLRFLQVQSVTAFSVAWKGTPASVSVSPQTSFGPIRRERSAAAAIPAGR